MRKISTSNGCRSMRSVDDGLRPNASETCLPAPANFPLGEDQLSSTMASVLTLRICCCLTEFGIRKPEIRIRFPIFDLASSSEQLRVLVGARNVGLIVAGGCCRECAAVVGS